MGNPKSKTVKLLLEDGTLKGVMSIVDSNWNPGEMYVAPRESIDSLLSSEACNKFGVYLLLAENKVYVGQSSDLAKRVRQHIAGKDWWERVLILTTADDSLNRSDIDYLEYYLIRKANDNNRLDSDNKSRGNTPKVDKFRKPELEQYLEEALFLMELIGINVFLTKGKKSIKSEKNIATVYEQQSSIVIQKKKQAKDFLEQFGIQFGKNVNYASRQESRGEFWVNPKKEVVSQDWELVLNNQFIGELIYIKIPAKTFKINKSPSDGGLFLRNDKPYIDLNINENTFIDRRSLCDFSEYIIKRVKYL